MKGQCSLHMIHSTIMVLFWPKSISNYCLEKALVTIQKNERERWRRSPSNPNYGINKVVPNECMTAFSTVLFTKYSRIGSWYDLYQVYKLHDMLSPRASSAHSSSGHLNRASLLPPNFAMSWDLHGQKCANDSWLCFLCYIVIKLILHRIHSKSHSFTPKTYLATI